MRLASRVDTARTLIDSSLKLGLDCPVCPHVAVFDPEKIRDRDRPCYQLPFRCSACGERKIQTFVLAAGDEEPFRRGERPRAHHHHSRL
jgi:hypothetical protein